MSKPLLAFSIQDDESAEIVFAASREEACADEIGCAGDPGVQCTRTEWADQYAPGPVPKMVMIDNGWWWECYGCECRIDSDLLADVFGDDGFELEPRALDPVERGGAIFCTAACMAAHDEAIRQRKAREKQVLEYMRALALSRLPGIALTGRDHVYVTTNERGDLECYQAYVGFRFPGCTIADAHFNYENERTARGDNGEQPHVTVCAGDKDAFNAWRNAALIHKATPNEQ